MEVRGSVVNLDKMPSISPTYESGQDILKTINMISNMHLCESSKPSPSYPVLVHNSKIMRLRCQKIATVERHTKEKSTTNKGVMICYKEFML